MIAFDGQNALSPFRLDRLNARLDALHRGARVQASWFVYFLDAERKVVMRLFEDEDGLYDTDPNVTPRFYLMAPYDEDGTGGESDGAD